MRDLTKAFSSWAWANVAFSTQQMFYMLGLGGSSSNRVARDLDTVREATENALGDPMRAAFRAGDSFQRGMIDVALAPLNLFTGGRATNSTSSGRTPTDWGTDTRGCGGDAGAAASGDGWSRASRCGESRDDGWVDAAVKATAAGVDAMRSAVDLGAQSVRRGADDTSAPSADRAPSSSGWGPMPR